MDIQAIKAKYLGDSRGAFGNVSDPEKKHELRAGLKKETRGKDPLEVNKNMKTFEEKQAGEMRKQIIKYVILIKSFLEGDKKNIGAINHKSIIYENALNKLKEAYELMQKKSV